MQEIKLPQLGQSVEEASIVQWLKKEGDTVQAGEPLYSVQTDKAEIEVEAPASGVLRKIVVPENVDVPVLTVVALIGGADEPLPELAAAPAAPKPSTPAKTSAVSTPAAPAPGVSQQPRGGKVFVSPRARKAAARHHVDAAALTGSGAMGRVIEADVLAFQRGQDAVKSTPAARRLARQRHVDLTQIQATGPRGHVVLEDVTRALEMGAPPGEVVPLTPMRRIIAERMSQSKFTAPHYYVTVEVDMKAAVAYREGAAGFKPSYNDLVVRAVVRALMDFPQVNAQWRGDGIAIMPDINIGVAVALESGLIVPVLRQAQRMSLQDISRESKTLAEKARTGKLLPDDYAGNTFTVSNLGAFGVDQFTAIINQPDSAILAVGRIKDSVTVIDGGIQIRPMMNLTLSSDHRVIDGALAARFMGRLREILEAADF